MTALIGETAVRRIIATQDHCPWIYAVLNDEAVRAINERHGLIVP